MNAYMFFTIVERKNLGSDLKGAAAMTELGVRWKALDANAKKPFEVDAEKDVTSFLFYI
jgi:hypothetical protein